MATFLQKLDKISVGGRPFHKNAFDPGHLAQFGKYENSSEKIGNSFFKFINTMTICAGQDKKHFEK
jgi:hypothetical protein